MSQDDRAEDQDPSERLRKLTNRMRALETSRLDQAEAGAEALQLLVNKVDEVGPVEDQALPLLERILASASVVIGHGCVWTDETLAKSQALISGLQADLDAAVQRAKELDEV